MIEAELDLTLRELLHHVPGSLLLQEEAAAENAAFAGFHYAIKAKTLGVALAAIRQSIDDRDNQAE
jgi:hypothetical protein